jgi:hypothetical protein
MLRLLAFDGLAGCGKDAISDGLVRMHGFTKVPFALPMKRILAKVFGIPEHYFHVRALKDSPFKDSITLTPEHLVKLVDELAAAGLSVGTTEVMSCQAHLGRSLTSPRDIMQYVGTNIVRKDIDNLAWIKLWDIEQRKYDKVIAPDARFSDEREYVHKIHGKVLLVKRDGVEAMTHVSENDKWPEDKYDAVIYNNVSLGRIQSEVSLWYTIVK